MKLLESKAWVRCLIVGTSFLLMSCTNSDNQVDTLSVAEANIHQSAATVDASEPLTRPNILLVVADDLGFTDIGSFGGEIPTPTLDSLAYDGVRLTNLHAAPSCQPTRTMLMASVPNGDGIENRPPLEGGERNNLLRQDWATIPELLKQAGYATYVAGKWDLGWDQGYTPATRGFDRSFVQLNGAASFFAEPLLLVGTTGYEEDGQPLEYSDLPQDFYATDTYTNKMLQYLQQTPEDQPWFAYLPYTSPHWPLQLPDAWLDRHAGNYNAGYDVLRQQRVTAAQAQGVLSEDFTLEGFDSAAVPWHELSEDEQAHYARAQEIYAGMVEHLDMSVGRVIDYLQQSGQLQNTLVIFMSDHGASGAEFGAAQSRYGQVGGPQPRATINNSLENFGRTNSFIDHGYGFAEAATAPFKGTKGTMNEGGLRAAAFVYYPNRIPQGEVRGEFMSMMDWMPTLLQVIGEEYPTDRFNGRNVRPIRGVSAWDYLVGHAQTVHTDAVGWSSNRGGALIQGNYKIIKQSFPRQGIEGEWQLYDLQNDPGERENIAAQQPERVAQMAAEWENNWQ